MSEKANEVVLQVAGNSPQDANRGIARLPGIVFEILGLRSGDIIEIEGKRSTGAIAVPVSAEDEGLSIVRIDGLTRTNCGAGIGERVTVRRIEAPPARRITLAPAMPGVRLVAQGEVLRGTLLHRPVAAGDVISTALFRQFRSLGRPDPIAETIWQMLAQHQQAFALQEIRLSVVSTQPRGIVRVADDTEIEILPEYTDAEAVARASVTYDDLGGLGDTIQQVREMIELPLKHPELFHRLGIEPPKGVLLYGPPGTGKTMLARAVANESNAAFFHIAGPEIMGRYYGESEQRLRDIFQQAEEKAPAIIFIDEIDSIAPKRDEVTGEVERRVVAQLLTLMDGLKPRRNVIVIAATNRPDSLDEALRRPGRFDREIVIGVPDRAGRAEILAIHTRGMPLAEDVNIDELSRITHGFVGADLAALAREAAMETLRRNLPDIDLNAKEIPSEVLARLQVTRADFMNALRRVQPSAMREIMIQTPNVTWGQIGGLEEAKQALREGVELPLKNPDAFRRIGIRPAKGFLLYGPPGTGKTLLAKAVARESEANFIAVKSSDLLSKWYGESERQISRLFKRARQVAPVVIFIDEIDALVPARGTGIGDSQVTERVVNTLLAEMDGIEELQGVVVIGATNRPTLLDPALLRPGRFDELIYVPVPDEKAREHILRIHTRGMPLANDVDLAELAQATRGYTGADLENLVRKTGMMAIREDINVREIPMRLFRHALEDSRPSVTPEMEREYEELREELKRHGARARKIGFFVADNQRSAA